MLYQNFDIQLEQVDGRPAISRMSVVRLPWLADIVRSMPEQFSEAANSDWLFYYPRGDAPRQALAT